MMTTKDDNRAELAGNISNLLQEMIATENRQLLFIGQFVKWSTGAVRGGQPCSTRNSPPQVLLWVEIRRKSRSIMLLTVISGHDFAGNQRRNSSAPEISGSRFGQRTHPSLCSHVERGLTSV
jgi:hypothetical protein